MIRTLTELFAALVDIERPMLPGAEPYALRPLTINPPAIYNVLLPTGTDRPDTGTIRDGVLVGVRLVITHTDAPADGLHLMELADRAIRVLDDALTNRDGPLGGILATRQGIRAVTDTFDTIPVQGIELPVQFRLERPNPVL